MLKGVSTRALLLGALLCPLVALLTIGALVLTFSPATPVVEANVWPQSVDLAESLHAEAILAAQLEVADGNASRTALVDRRARTDELLDRWSSAGTASGQVEAQLEAVRIVDEGRDVPEADELLQLADAVRQEAVDTSPGVDGVAELVLAARSDASLAVQGSGVATLTTAAKAQRTRIDGMAALNSTMLDGSLPPGSEALRSVLADTSDLHAALIAGDPVTIGQWTDGHLERQRAIAEVARVQALAGLAEVPVANAFPTSAALAAGIAGLFALLVFGGLVFRRLNTGAHQLEDHMLRFAKRTLPESMSASEADHVPLSEQIVPVEVSGDLQGVAQAFNKVQESTAYIVDEERSANTFVINRVFQSLAERNRTGISEQLAIVDDLVRDETDLAKLEQLAQLDTRLRRMDRDVVSLSAMGGEASPALFGDLALSVLVELAVKETHSVDRVRLVPVDDVLVDGSCAADVAHVVTELLENALHSSPPESLVEVMCNHTDRGSLVVSIADEGFGMDADEMDGLNRELASFSKVKPETAGTLGIVAISAIAERSGIDVRFTDSPTTGVTALVTVPAESITALPKDWMPEVGENVAFASVDDRVDNGDVAELQHVVDEPDEPPLVEATSFDRDLPVAEFEYDLDGDVPAPSAVVSEFGVSDVDEGFGLGDDDDGLDSDDTAGSGNASDIRDDETASDAEGLVEDVEETLAPSFEAADSDEIPLSMVDYDKSPFEAATDDQLEQRSGAELLNPLNRRQKEPAPHFGPKKRAKRTVDDASSRLESDTHDPIGAEVDADIDALVNDVEEDVDIAKDVDVAKGAVAAEIDSDQQDSVPSADAIEGPADLVADDTDLMGHSTTDDAEEISEEADEPEASVAVPRMLSDDDDIEPGPTYEVDTSYTSDDDSSTTYSALGSLLANLPERVEDVPVEPAVVAKSGVARRIPNGSSSVPPSQLGISVPERPKNEPKTPDDIRKLLAKYRAADDS